MGMAYFIRSINSKRHRIRKGKQMKMFNKLSFDEVRSGHFQARQQIGKYELSVILLPRQTLYEAAIFEDNSFVRLPGISNDYDDVIPGLTPDAVDAIMIKLSTIEAVL